MEQPKNSLLDSLIANKTPRRRALDLAIEATSRKLERVKEVVVGAVGSSYNHGVMAEQIERMVNLDKSLVELTEYKAYLDSLNVVCDSNFKSTIVPDFYICRDCGAYYATSDIPRTKKCIHEVSFHWKNFISWAVSR